MTKPGKENGSAVQIRIARPSDAGELQKIYAPYVENSAVTFELEPPDTAEFGRRIENTLRQYPYLVAEADGRIAGYAYAGPFRTRAAYRYAAEVSIYLAPEKHGQGIGRLLYRELEALLGKQNICVLYACITTTERADDEHLTDGSVRFHEKTGYRQVGAHHLCGTKFGKWYSVIWMEKDLAERKDDPDPFIPFPDIRQMTGQ